MQYNFFNLGVTEKYKISKPIRLIELFGGIGSQAKALTNLGVEFKHYRLVEFDKYAIQSYNAIHNTNFIAQDITQTSASDLGIVETDKYEYIVTYSFPCTDLSLAGKREGMAKGSRTRSGLLWEVERILTECKQLPQILLMENVPQVLNSDFGGWLEFLESKGYTNHYAKLNAKDYGIPQNRERVFMVSILGKYLYEFPGKIPLKLRLKDMLESNVDEKYYISNTKIKKIITSNFAQEKAIIQTTDICGTILAIDYKDPKCVPINSSEPKCEVVATLDIPGRIESACRIHGIDGIAPTCNTCSGGGHETKILEPIICAMRGRNPDNLKSRKAGIPTVQKLEIGGSVSNTLTTVQKDNLVAEPNERFFRQAIEIANENEGNSISLEQSNIKNINSENELFTTLGPNCGSSTSSCGGVVAMQNYRIRKLTPKECWRLMGFSDTDFDKAKESGVSNCQLYKQAGNSIVVNVLMAIFGELR